MVLRDEDVNEVVKVNYLIYEATFIALVMVNHNVEVVNADKNRGNFNLSNKNVSTVLIEVTDEPVLLVRVIV